MTHHKHNYFKFKILDAVRFDHRTVYEITRLLEPTLNPLSKEFKDKSNKVSISTGRLSKKYDPTLSMSARGYSIPYLTKRWIGSEGEQIRRHGRHEYRATQKGRRLVCEWLYRIEIGHTDLKWTGRYFNPMIATCGIKCESCPECGGEVCLKPEVDICIPEGQSQALSAGQS